MNTEIFFRELKVRGLFTSLNQQQVNGISALLSEGMELLGANLPQLAYVMATAYHETAKTMQPIEEYKKGEGKPYGQHFKMAKDKNGKHISYIDTTEIFYGRGFVQLTWYENYFKAGKLLCLNLLKNPKLALDLKNATKILFDGMIHGWFTGKKLSDYIGVKNDFVGARRIVNLNDCASLIASHAISFLTCLNNASKQ